jgi:hypothetical protein
MHRLSHAGCHTCAPKGWHDVPVVSGDYDMDASIRHSSNKALPERLKLYTKRGKSYGPKTAYSGYHGYRGDD